MPLTHQYLQSPKLHRRGNLSHLTIAMNWNDYYMNIAIAVRDKANCLGRKVGAILVKENRIISTGYNGTPEGMQNCTDGGCVRCKNREKYKNNIGYDVCICVHAEQNAVLSAARFGISIENSIAYTTMRPCFDCSKALLQAKVKAVYYLHDWSHPIPELQEQYALIQKQFPKGVKKLKLPDPREEWANLTPPQKLRSLPPAMKGKSKAT